MSSVAELVGTPNSWTGIVILTCSREQEIRADIANCARRKPRGNAVGPGFDSAAPQLDTQVRGICRP